MLLRMIATSINDANVARNHIYGMLWLLNIVKETAII